MAQLNPNFEIDFSDINSYEQIQLINDTQLAKENLLMHRAYKEPADDAIIRNQFSSFTFVDFCPKLFSFRPTGAATTTTTTTTPTTAKTNNNAVVPDNANGATNIGANSYSIRHFELESFSDLFERINKWLKLNKDWRVVSMETLVFDCTSQFNHLKSSIHQNYLPKNTRGLRLFLSPSKSRFSGPQKIGCINVVPRKVSGSYLRPSGAANNAEPIQYENLDQILARLNELLLTRPIEGRILSVETITLPIINGYVNTETNYYMDNRLNSLYQSTYMPVNTPKATTASPNGSTAPTAQATPASPCGDSQMLIDILRVYYEFGPMVCGLVNLIDFIPRFYSSASSSSSRVVPNEQPVDEQAGEQQDVAGGEQHDQERAIVCGDKKIAATESLTRLIRRSLTWFEAERKRILAESTSEPSTSKPVAASVAPVNLKACNVQVHHKIMLKNDLIQVNAANALEKIDTRSMAHERPQDACIACAQCSTSTATTPVHEWCLDLIDLSQAYELKFVRLAYVVPVNSKYSAQLRSIGPARPLRTRPEAQVAASSATAEPELLIDHQEDEQTSSSGSSSTSTSSSASSSSSSTASSPDTSGQRKQSESNTDNEAKSDHNQEEEDDELSEDDLKIVEELLAKENAEECNKQAALAMINETNEKHKTSEQAHQLSQDDDGLNDAPIGQLSYRLFAPCQLVNSSSCFAINPVNSSNPLARRGSVDLNGGGLSSENAHPSSLLLGPNHANSEQHHHSDHHQHHSHQVISFGALFSSKLNDISHDSSNSSHGRQAATGAGQSSSSNGSGGSATGAKFTTNEFESVEAIRRRMEIYVTTNSMKVIAGETLIVNLSDVLSCLSTAIEQTVIKASFIHRAAPSTWVSVYVLYAAVDEPPSQLLEHQKHRERLAQISETDECSGQDGGDNETSREDAKKADPVDQMVPMFEDDFKLDPARKQAEEPPKQQVQPDEPSREQNKSDRSGEQEASQEGSIRIEQNPVDSSLTLYNSAYDRTVPLPTQPDNHLGHFVEPNEFLGSQSDYTWLDGDELLEAQQKLHLQRGDLLMAGKASVGRRKGRKSSKVKSSKRSAGHVDSGCSIM